MADEDIFNAQQQIENINEVRNVLRQRRRRPKIYRKRTDPLDKYSDIEFKKIYRIPKDLCRQLIIMVKNRLDEDEEVEEKRGGAISVDLQVLATMRYLAKGAYQQDVADLHGISQSRLSVIIARIVRVISTYLPEYIKFPTEGNKIRDLKAGFFEIAGMPGIVGAIDCTHIRIKNPGGEHPALYINRKGFFSLNVQVVCDSKCRIMDIVARWRGSAHDSRIWDLSSLKNKFQNGEIQGILVGDGGYAATNYMLTPILNPLGQREERYNAAHIRTRNCIERLFGQWKSKFRCLYNCINVSLDTAKATIVAAAVLHNMHLSYREENGMWL